MIITQALKPIRRPERVLFYGEGNFLRAFAGWMIDILNEKTDFNGNIIAVKPRPGGFPNPLAEQQGLYTTVIRGIERGKPVEEIRPVRSVSRCINAFEQYDEYSNCAEIPELRFIISNTTEAGIVYRAGETLADKPQVSFPGKLTAFLYKRYLYFRGDPSKALALIPCELIEKNGRRLKELVITYGKEWQLEPGFFTWLEGCVFCDSLVDRIVSGFPAEEAEALYAKIGYEDKLMAAAEAFYLWVIETGHDVEAELPFKKAGLNVLVTGDLTPYRTQKVRILNGAHTMTVAAAFLYGLKTVRECMDDPLIYTFMRRGIFEEILPSMDGSLTELEDYAERTLERFSNPSIKHALLSITLNSVSKFKARILPSLEGYIKKTGKLPRFLIFSLAALIVFYEGKETGSGELSGVIRRPGEQESYPIRDDPEVLRCFAAWYSEEPEKTVHNVLSKTEWWGKDLTIHTGLEEAVTAYWKNIRTKGVGKVIAELTGDIHGGN
jgi:tagaturonate reductase